MSSSRRIRSGARSRPRWPRSRWRLRRPRCRGWSDCARSRAAACPRLQRPGLGESAASTCRSCHASGSSTSMHRLRLNTRLVTLRAGLRRGAGSRHPGQPVHRRRPAPDQPGQHLPAVPAGGYGHRGRLWPRPSHFRLHQLVPDLRLVLRRALLRADGDRSDGVDLTAHLPADRDGHRPAGRRPAGARARGPGATARGRRPVRRGAPARGAGPRPDARGGRRTATSGVAAEGVGHRALAAVGEDDALRRGRRASDRRTARRVQRGEGPAKWSAGRVDGARDARPMGTHRSPDARRHAHRRRPPRAHQDRRATGRRVAAGRPGRPIRCQRRSPGVGRRRPDRGGARPRSSAQRSHRSRNPEADRRAAARRAQCGVARPANATGNHHGFGR